MDFSLIETMRWQPETGFVRLNLHMTRLQTSAKLLGFKGTEDAKLALRDFVESKRRSGLISPLEGEMSRSDRGGHPAEVNLYPPLSAKPTSPPQGGRLTGPEAAHRVRLELFPNGRISITSAPFTLQEESTVWSVKIASARLSSTDTLLRHKTSNRAAYDQARAEVSKDQADEVLLLNEKGELCEGTITSLFVEGDNGMLLTPPLSSGLLAGVLRTSLLCAKKARVQKLMPDALKGKTVYVGNSLRGLIRAHLES